MHFSPETVINEKTVIVLKLLKAFLFSRDLQRFSENFKRNSPFDQSVNCCNPSTLVWTARKSISSKSQLQGGFCLAFQTKQDLWFKNSRPTILHTQRYGHMVTQSSQSGPHIRPPVCEDQKNVGHLGSPGAKWLRIFDNDPQLQKGV